MNAEFDLWTKESLVLFARDAAQRMREQQAEIEALREERRAAIDAYRNLLRQLKVAV